MAQLKNYSLTINLPRHYYPSPLIAQAWTLRIKKLPKAPGQYRGAAEIHSSGGRICTQDITISCVLHWSGLIWRLKLKDLKSWLFSTNHMFGISAVINIVINMYPCIGLIRINTTVHQSVIASANRGNILASFYCNSLIFFQNMSHIILVTRKYLCCGWTWLFPHSGVKLLSPICLRTIKMPENIFITTYYRELLYKLPLCLHLQLW